MYTHKHTLCSLVMFVCCYAYTCAATCDGVRILSHLCSLQYNLVDVDHTPSAGNTCTSYLIPLVLRPCSGQDNLGSVPCRKHAPPELLLLQPLCLWCKLFCLCLGLGRFWLLSRLRSSKERQGRTISKRAMPQSLTHEGIWMPSSPRGAIVPALAFK